MRIGMGTPPNAAPSTGSSFLVSILSSDTWVSSRPDGKVGERIVQEWRWANGGMELRLKLRPNVYFHDGTPLTAQTAADALRATNTSRQNLSLRSIASVEAEGPDTLLLRMREHNAFLLDDLSAVPVLKPHARDEPEIGTGPFVPTGRNGNEVALAAFPRYYHGRPALAGIDVVDYRTQRNAWAALMRGDIDMLYEVSRDSAEFVQAESAVRTYSFPRPYYILIAFNMRHPVLRNVEVRRAINEALDREALVRDGMRGQGAPADGPIPPQHWAYSAPQPFTYNPAEVRRRLDAAGFPLRPDAERRVPIRFSFKCLALGNDPRFERLSMIAQRQLAAVGIDMQVQPLDVDNLVNRMGSGDFDAFVLELSGARLSRVYDFWRSRDTSTDPSTSNTGYRAADLILDRIRSSQSDEETRAAVADLLRVMHDDPPAAFIAWQQSSRAVSTRFDVAAEPDRDILTMPWRWRLAPSQPQARAR
jgi:peptide/nickel transport system substrate-binding protein